MGFQFASVTAFYEKEFAAILASANLVQKLDFPFSNFNPPSSLHSTTRILELGLKIQKLIR